MIRQNSLLLASALVLALVAGCNGANHSDTASHAAVTATTDNFDAMIADGVTLVDFWATWCPPCVKQGPIVEDIAVAYKGRATVAKLDVDAHRAVAERFKITSIPTLIIFKDGKEVARLVALQSEKELKAALDKQL